MTPDPSLLAGLQALHPAILTGVVRQAQGSTSFDLGAWSVRPLSAAGLANPNGLWLFSGQGAGADGAARPWSVVLKILQRPAVEVPSATCGIGSASCTWPARASPAAWPRR